MYISADDVVYPTTRWRLVDVLLDSGEDQAAYALGWWNEKPAMGFRWNGGKFNGKLGSPQLRGLPTWTILDPLLHAAVIPLLPPEKQSSARRFLGLSAPADWRPAIKEVQDFHRRRLAAIASGQTPVPTPGKASLGLHVVPLFEAHGLLSSQLLLEMAERFPPPQSRRPALTQSHNGGILNGSGGGPVQRSYVHVSQNGAIEAVVSGLCGAEDAIYPDKLAEVVVTYSRHYAAGLRCMGIAPPYAVMAGLAGDVAHAAPIPRNVLEIQPLPNATLEFPVGLFETVPAGREETLNSLKELLTRMHELPRTGLSKLMVEPHKASTSGSAELVWTCSA